MGKKNIYIYLYFKGEILDESPKIGELYCVKFKKKDLNFFRGLVKSNVEDVTCLIHFVDYGFAERIPFGNLFPISKKLKSIPFLAVEITLHGVEVVDSFSKNSRNYFEKLIEGKTDLILVSQSIEI